ncbi:flagellar biosynthesis protein FlgJ [Roseovarius spongiae]|uniref:Flagellar biosynthesis protein FlgJ n=2 Tax=Roseovarius spongiae TaxID=2320272 RepID=A0A3A8B4H7_9RHOB|nr:flagellar biosynthesis protein FlgJ [Roseovarius spongiae]
MTPRPGVAAASPAREAAERLEAAFLAEMLKAAGLGTQPKAFGGGIGEEQFASFQRQALAEEMVRSGGIGLADSFYQALMEKNDDR